MSYPFQLSRGLATSFLKEVEKRNERIEKILKGSNLKIKSKAHIKTMERLFSRLPVYTFGRSENRRFYVCYLEKAYYNPVGGWDEDSFSIEKIELPNIDKDRRIDIVVSRHAIERIFERSPENCINAQGKPDVLKIYDFIYDLPLWKEYIFALTFNLAIFGFDHSYNGDRAKKTQEYLKNTHFMIPCKGGVFFLQSLC